MTPQQQIACARAQTGLSQRELGALLGVSTRTVNRWEAGERPVPYHALLALPNAIARALARPRDDRPRRGAPIGPKWPKRVYPDNHPHLYEWTRVGRKRVPCAGGNARHPRQLHGAPAPGYAWFELTPGQYALLQVSTCNNS